MDIEIQALKKNKTWELVPLPKGKKTIGSKWVFKTKLKADESLERYKARLVAKGYNQNYGVDYEKTFSPVIKMTTISCLIAIVVSKKWNIYQLDVNNVFLHGDLKEEVYMQPPPRCPYPTNKVCRLTKSLYGLKQALRQLLAKLTQELLHQDYSQSKNDYSLFIKKEGHTMTFLAIYVDDVIITRNNN